MAQKDSLQSCHATTEGNERRKISDVNEKARDGLGEKRKEGAQAFFQVPKPQMPKQNSEEGPFG